MPDLTVLFDGSCALCRASAARVRRLDRLHRIEFLDVNLPELQVRFPQINKEAALRWMQAIDAQGRVSSASDAWARIGLLLPGWRWLAWILLVPGIRSLARVFYSWIARNRYRWNREACADGSCAVHAPHDASPER